MTEPATARCWPARQKVTTLTSGFLAFSAPIRCSSNRFFNEESHSSNCGCLTMRSTIVSLRPSCSFSAAVAFGSQKHLMSMIKSGSQFKFCLTFKLQVVIESRGHVLFTR